MQQGRGFRQQRLGQARHHGFLAREILIHRSNADSGHLGDGIGAQPRIPMALQNPSAGLHHGGDGGF